LRPALIILDPAPLTLRSRFPIESTGFPDMDQTKKKDEDEKTDVGITRPAEPLVGNRPGGDKEDLDIEDNKEDRNQVKGHRAFKPGIVERQNARLVRLLLLSRAGLVAKPPGKQQKNRNQENGYTTIDSQSQVRLEIGWRRHQL